VCKAKEETGSSSLLMQSPALSFQVALCLLTNNRKRKGDKEETQGLLGENEDFGDKFVVGHSFLFHFFKLRISLGPFPTILV
jgi:hypothetical protein